MKKIVLTFVIVLVLVLALGVTAYAGSDVIKVNADSSTVSINYNTNDYSNLKVVVKKGTEQYNYDLFSYGEDFPLQMGNGNYAVGLYEKVEGNKYKRIQAKTVRVNAKENTVYLASVQNVKWNDESDMAILTTTLIENLETDTEKVAAIHDYVVENITYDDDKARFISKGYNPSAEETLVSGSGICYDFASVTAAMLRSVDIPTKLVKGKSNVTRVYHSWNEVLVDGEWIVVDTSTDSVNAASGIELSFEKDSSDYFADKVY